MSQKIKFAFITILIVFIMSFSSVYAVNTTPENAITDVLNYLGLTAKQSEIQKAVDVINQYNYYTISCMTKRTFTIYVSDELPYKGSTTDLLQDHYIQISLNNTYGTFTISDSLNKVGIQIVGTPNNYYYYVPYGALNSEKTDYYIQPGYESKPILEEANRPQKAYFEWAGKQIGTTNLENFDGNIPCFYPSSFENFSNSWASFKRIGYIYIDEDYILDNVFTDYRDFTIYNMSQTKSWTYRNDVIFTEIGTNQDGYAIYKINIELQYINTPYIYTMKFISRDTDLAENIYINFVLLTETTEGGGIVVESGDQNISGDFTKDETTLGDLDNTIENIFQNPDKDLINKETEDLIDKIKEDITQKLEENEIIGALDLAEEGLIDILKGEAGDFKISWDEVTYKDVALIPEGEVNFSKMARDNQSIGYVKETLNIVLSGFMAINILKTLYNLIMEMLGVSSPIINEQISNDLNLKKGGK